MKTASRVLLSAAILAVASTSGAAAQARQMVRVPAGTYRSLYSQADMQVAAFRLDRDPVTRAEYLAWSGSSERLSAKDARRPMTEVTWKEAEAFCRSRGGRLPTVVEWEYAAAQSDPKAILSAYSLRSGTPPPIDSGQVNGLGVRGMHDLVYEWVADPNDRFGAHHHHHEQGATRDMSCAGAAIDAADPSNYPAFLRSALRSGLTESSSLASLGFRCAA